MGARLFTALASLLLMAIFGGANIAAQNWLAPVRADMTENRLYTLSAAAREVASGLTEPIELEFVYSRSLAADYPAMRAYGRRVRELLNEISARSRGMVRIRETDPAPFSLDEDRIIESGLHSSQTDSGDPLYFGVIGHNSVDDEIIIPFLAPERESLLEYDLVKLMSQLDDPSPPRIGVITALPELSGYGRNQSDFYILREIARSFSVVRIPGNFVALPDDIDALLIVQPPDLTGRQQYAIEQFLLTRGRALVALDPASRSALSSRGRRARLSSGLGKVETTLGLSPLRDVVIDRKIGLPVERLEGERRVVEVQPLFIAPPPSLMSRLDPVTSDLSRPVHFGATGRLVANPPEGATFEPLIWTSEDAALTSVQVGGRDVSPKDLLVNYAPTGRSQVLAGRLSGRLHSSFTGDIPPLTLPDDPVEARLLYTPSEDKPHVADSETDAEIILVADADIFDDSFYVSPNGDSPVADNAAFVLNALDNLAGSDALVRLRSRAPSARPMIRIDAMRDEARARLYEEQANLESQLKDTEARLKELKAAGAGGGLLASADGEISPDEAEELSRFQAEASEIRQRLREIEREFRADIDALEGRIIVLNMWVPAIAVALFGVMVVALRSRRKAKR